MNKPSEPNNLSLILADLCFRGGIQVVLRDDVPAGKVIVVPRQESPWLIQRPKLNLRLY